MTDKLVSIARIGSRRQRFEKQLAIGSRGVKMGGSSVNSLSPRFRRATATPFNLVLEARP